MNKNSNYNTMKICASKHELPEHIKNAKGDFAHLAAAFYSEKIWDKNSTIKIKFLDENPDIPRTPISSMNTTNGPIDPLQKEFSDNTNIKITDAIKRIVNERIQPLVSLKFQFVDTNQDADVRIGFDRNNGAWSLLGTDAKNEDKDKPTMNLGWFDVSTVIHEFGHVLGMIHEHQNPRGQSIDWNEKKVYEWAETTQGWDKETTKRNIMDKYDINSINGSSFDPLSIMLYFFPPDLTNNNKGTYQNLRLSGLDMEFINKNYGKENATSFFQQIYGNSLQDNINKSNQLVSTIESTSASGNGNKSTNISTKNNLVPKIIIIIAIILVILFIVFLLVKILHKKK
jgi:hypothetical protein